MLKAENIRSAEQWQTTAGTEGPGPRFAGTMSKVGVDTWELELPANLLTTSFWAEATDLTGRKIKSADLGNVGYNVDAIDDAAASRFLSKNSTGGMQNISTKSTSALDRFGKGNINAF